MADQSPTEGIEPTIRRIAQDVCREYLGNILGRAVGLPSPAAKDDPTIEDHDPPWEGQYGPAMADCPCPDAPEKHKFSCGYAESVAVRKAREKERIAWCKALDIGTAHTAIGAAAVRKEEQAKAREQLIAQQRAHHEEVQDTKRRMTEERDAAVHVERAKVKEEYRQTFAGAYDRAKRVWEARHAAAVHQARVDALRYAADPKTSRADLLRELSQIQFEEDTRRLRLEREQAKTAPTPADAKCEECGVTGGVHYTTCSRHGLLPCGKCTTGVYSHACSEHGPNRQGQGRADAAVASLPEAKGAPEQLYVTVDADGWPHPPLSCHAEISAHWVQDSDVAYVRADVVERRVVEGRKQYDVETEQACADLAEAHAVLGCKATETTLSGVRRVVADRDAARTELKDLQDTTGGPCHFKERAVAAEAELARVRGELADREGTITELTRRNKEHANALHTLAGRIFG